MSQGSIFFVKHCSIVKSSPNVKNSLKSSGFVEWGKTKASSVCYEASRLSLTEQKAFQ